MKNTRASERYAKSLLMLAIEKKILDKVKQLNDELMQRAKEIRLLKSEQIKTQKIKNQEYKEYPLIF